MQLLYGIAGAAATAAGIYCLYGKWKGFLGGGVWRLLEGWALLLAAAFFWVRAFGPEFGVALVLLATGLAAWTGVAINARVREAANAPPHAGRKLPFAPRRFPRHILLFVIAIPVAAVASALAVAAMARLLPWTGANQAVFAILMLPVVWGLASYWACADPKIVRPAAILIAAGGLAAAHLYL